MKITLSITNLDQHIVEAIEPVIKGIKLHYSAIGIVDGCMEELTISDERDIDVDELVEVLKAMKAATWKVQGVGGDDL